MDDKLIPYVSFMFIPGNAELTSTGCIWNRLSAARALAEGDKSQLPIDFWLHAILNMDLSLTDELNARCLIQLDPMSAKSLPTTSILWGAKTDDLMMLKINLTPKPALKISTEDLYKAIEAMPDVYKYDANQLKLLPLLVYPYDVTLFYSGTMRGDYIVDVANPSKRMKNPFVEQRKRLLQKRERITGKVEHIWKEVATAVQDKRAAKEAAEKAKEAAENIAKETVPTASSTDISSYPPAQKTEGEISFESELDNVLQQQFNKETFAKLSLGLDLDKPLPDTRSPLEVVNKPSDPNSASFLSALSLSHLDEMAKSVGKTLETLGFNKPVPATPAPPPLSVPQATEMTTSEPKKL
jgi:hypothetical protein